jgi:hypothetical protein
MTDATILEGAVLATVALHPDRFDAAAAILDQSDFLRVGNRQVWQLLAELHADGRPDLPTVLDAAGRAGDGEMITLALREALAGDTPSVSLLERHCRRIVAEAMTRRLGDRLAVAVKALHDGADGVTVADELGDDLERLARPASALPDDYVTPSALIAQSVESPRPWVLPGLLRRQGRAVVVAPEGRGKSTVLRQVSVCAAAGLHPFDRRRIDPVRCLVADFENDHQASARLDEPPGALDPTSFAALVNAARITLGDDGWDPDATLRVWSRPRGVNLRDRADRNAFEAILADCRPELVAAGPTYKLARRAARESDEDMAGDVQAILDRLRDRYGFALILEHHAPKAVAGAERVLEPIGTSLWLRWPDLGIGMRPVKDRPSVLTLGRFRGDRYRVAWPDELHRAGPQDLWPWTGHRHGGTP